MKARHVASTGLSHALFTASRWVSTMSPPSGVSTTALINVCAVTGTTTVVTIQTPSMIEARCVALKLANRFAAPIEITILLHSAMLPITIAQTVNIDGNEAPLTNPKKTNGISVTSAKGTKVTSARADQIAWALRAVTLSNSKRRASRSFAFKS